MQNIHKIDSVIRITLASVLIISAVHYHAYGLLLPASYLLYSGFTYFCIIYDLLNIDKAFSHEKELVMELPKLNPAPVFIFNKSGHIAYKNKPSNTLMPHITHLQDLWVEGFSSINNIIHNNEHHIIKVKNGEQHVSVSVIGVKKKNIIVAYTQDITEIVKADQEIIQTQKEIVYTMGEIGESRSQETGNHVKRVAEYSALFAQKLGLSFQECELIKMASPMHDIGKVAIPDSILNKPGKLTADEWEIMKTHSQLGYEMLKHSDREILKASAIIAKEHHEKFDGSGYPDGLKGEDIHIYARITAMADVFDALGSERVYKKAWPLPEILALFKKERQKHFDPKLVDILMENLPLFVDIRDRYKDKF